MSDAHFVIQQSAAKVNECSFQKLKIIPLKADSSWAIDALFQQRMISYPEHFNGNKLQK